jgi:RHO1 GDP-GTP exchange protein 1/2
MTKPKEENGVAKYHVSLRPIPLDLLTLVTFSDPPRARSSSLLRGRRGGSRTTTPEPSSLHVPSTDEENSAQNLYPCTLYFNGGLGGLQTFYAESSTSREEWKLKLNEAIGIGRIVQ